jgi:hypothetical protein
MSAAINCNLLPKQEFGHIIEHRRTGGYVWNPDDLELYQHPLQQTGVVSGTDMWSYLRDKPVVNACVIEWLCGCNVPPYEGYPKEWGHPSQEKKIIFWGTISGPDTSEKPWSIANRVRYLTFGTEFIETYQHAQQFKPR